MPAAQPVRILPLPENPDVELIEAVTGDMLGRLARLAHDLNRDGTTGHNQREIRHYAEGLVHFTTDGMPVRRS